MLKRLCIVLLLQLCISRESLASKIITLEPSDAPNDVAFFNEDNNKMYLDQFEGKTILLCFWATWCAPCVQEMPSLDLLQKDFRKLPFVVIAVSQDFHGIEAVKNYFKSQEIRHLKIYHDYQNQLFKAFSVVGLPSTFLIDQDGKMQVLFKGSINWHDEGIRKIILSHIAGNPVEPKNSYKSQMLNQPVKSSVSKKEDIKNEPKIDQAENMKEDEKPSIKEERDEKKESTEQNDKQNGKEHEQNKK